MGEFGNYLAATRFSRVLRGAVDAEVTLLEAEPILPWLGEAGAEIRTISLESPDATARTRRYMALMARLQERFPAGFETAPSPSRSPIWPRSPRICAPPPRTWWSARRASWRGCAWPRYGWRGCPPGWSATSPTPGSCGCRCTAVRIPT
ncbi:hypothetical protein ACFQ2B_34505 [Streptomyces stramineus]